jgi:uncharacterized LabA/DUF88 family protein
LPDRAVLFVDGNNWYHALKDVGVKDLGRLDYRLISEKLVAPRTWIGTRCYIGRMDQSWSPKDYAAQRSFLARMEQDDPARIRALLGRLERRTEHNEAASELLHYLAGLSVRIDRQVFQDLVALGNRHRTVQVMVEKAVDVLLAVDMVMMAQRREYDAAFPLSADGDFTPAAQAVSDMGKRVYAASPLPGAQLRKVCNAFIPLQPDWFQDCYRSLP